MKKKTVKARERTKVTNEKKRKKPAKKTKTITSPAMILDGYVGDDDANGATIT